MTRGSPLLTWLGLTIAFLVAGLGFVLGFVQRLPALEVFFYSVATFAIIAWVWRYYTGPPERLRGAPKASPGSLPHPGRPERRRPKPWRARPAPSSGPLSARTGSCFSQPPR